MTETDIDGLCKSNRLVYYCILISQSLCRYSPALHCNYSVQFVVYSQHSLVTVRLPVIIAVSSGRCPSRVRVMRNEIGIDRQTAVWCFYDEREKLEYDWRVLSKHRCVNTLRTHEK